MHWLDGETKTRFNMVTQTMFQEPKMTRVAADIISGMQQTDITAEDWAMQVQKGRYYPHETHYHLWNCVVVSLYAAWQYSLPVIGEPDFIAQVMCRPQSLSYGMVWLRYAADIAAGKPGFTHELVPGSDDDMYILGCRAYPKKLKADARYYFRLWESYRKDNK